MTTKTDAARECAEEIAQRFDSWVSPDVILEIVSKHFPPSVPEGWMCDKEKVLELATHLEGIGWQMDSKDDIDCVDQGAAMAAEVIRRVLLPLIAEAK